MCRQGKRRKERPFFPLFFEADTNNKVNLLFPRRIFSSKTRKRDSQESATGPVRVLKTKSRENKRQLHKSLEVAGICPCNFQEEHSHSIYMYLYVSTHTHTCKNTHTHTLYQHYVYPPHMDTLSLSPSSSLSIPLPFSLDRPFPNPHTTPDPYLAHPTRRSDGALCWKQEVKGRGERER